jgi:hypothetical protein
VNRIIGFIGIDTYDIILYLARICCNYNEKVLLVDNSLSKSLFLCIPNLAELNSNIGYIDYLGVDFTTIAAENINSCEYDKVFIYYGLHNTNSDYSICNNYILVSDIQLHTLLAINEIEIDSSKVINIIMKDVYEVMIPDNKVLALLNLTGEVKIYTHYLDAWDIKYRVVCQEQNLTSFHKISNYLKEYLFETSKVLYPEQSRKELNNIIKKALKGK